MLLRLLSDSKLSASQNYVDAPSSAKTRHRPDAPHVFHDLVPPAIEAETTVAHLIRLSSRTEKANEFDGDASHKTVVRTP
jgi:hypothetical protein